MDRPPHRHASTGFTLIELLVVVAIIAILAALLLPAIGLVRDTAKSVRCLSHLRQFHLAAAAYAEDWNGALVPCCDNTNNYLWGLQLNPYLDASDQDPYGSISRRNLAWGCSSWTGRCYDGVNYAITSSGYGYNKSPFAVAGNAGLDSGLGAGQRVYQLSQISNASSRLMFCDWNDWQIASWGAPSVSNYPTAAVGPGWVPMGGMRHRNGMNICFFDGHSSKVSLADAGRAMLDPAHFSP